MQACLLWRCPRPKRRFTSEEAPRDSRASYGRAPLGCALHLPCEERVLCLSIQACDEGHAQGAQGLEREYTGREEQERLGACLLPSPPGTSPPPPNAGKCRLRVPRLRAPPACARLRALVRGAALRARLRAPRLRAPSACARLRAPACVRRLRARLRARPACVVCVRSSAVPASRARLRALPACALCVRCLRARPACAVCVRACVPACVRVCVRWPAARLRGAACVRRPRGAPACALCVRRLRAPASACARLRAPPACRGKSRGEAPPRHCRRAGLTLWTRDSCHRKCCHGVMALS